MSTPWHPIFLAEEPTPGTWVINFPGEHGPIGRIELRRVGDQVRYKVLLQQELIGWSTTLKVAVEQLWRAFIASKNPRDRPS